VQAAAVPDQQGTAQDGWIAIIIHQQVPRPSF